VKRYEALFIFKHTTKEESLKDIIDKLTSEIGMVGGKVETVQKMDKRNFSRVADKRYPSGIYVNFIFEAPGAAIAQLRTRQALNEDIFRIMFTEAAIAVEGAAAAPAQQ
jgi:ribosomal protein S6